MTEHLFDEPGPFDDGRPVHPCLQCRQPVASDGQPGDGRCDACGLHQYLTEPSPLYPAGGQGRYWSGEGLNPLGRS